MALVICNHVRDKRCLGKKVRCMHHIKHKFGCACKDGRCVDGGMLIFGDCVCVPTRKRRRK